MTLPAASARDILMELNFYSLQAAENLPSGRRGITHRAPRLRMDTKNTRSANFAHSPFKRTKILLNDNLIDKNVRWVACPGMPNGYGSYILGKNFYISRLHINFYLKILYNNVHLRFGSFVLYGRH